MKKLMILLTVMALFASCSKRETDSDQARTSGQHLKSSDKVDICHNGHVISVSVNALQAHLNHGDYVVTDADGDGFFTVAGACTGTLPDCDDNDAATYPGAEEICGDGIDNNCDGMIDEGCGPVVTPGAIPSAVLKCGSKWRNFRLNGSDWEIAVGDPATMGIFPVSGWDRVDFVADNYYFGLVSNNVFTYSYLASSGDHTVFASVRGGFYAKSVSKGIPAIDYLQIEVVAPAGMTVNYDNVVLTVGSNSYALGNFRAAGVAMTWNIDNFDLSDGFTLTGDAFIVGSASNADAARICVWSGNTP
jgi:hypothetical protein